MKAKFKLKKEARQFFDKKYHRYIEEIKFWTGCGIHENLLDEVENCYIEYGHVEKLNSNTTTTSLSGWEKNKAEFRFTLNVVDINHSQYDNINIAELMDEMQKTCNKFFKKYITDSPE